MNKSEFFNNPNNLYYGHGTGRSGSENVAIAKSIMDYGLRCSHNQLYYTSCCLTRGVDIDQEGMDMLDNWGHMDSKIIMIISLPIDYKIIDAGPTYGQGDASFYYVPTAEMREKNHLLTNSFYVRPEFVKGYYNANTKEFVKNPKYYEFLTEKEQQALFDKVKQAYFDIINNNWGIDNYREIIESNEVFKEMRFPLSDEEIAKYKLICENKKRIKMCEDFLGNLSDEIKNRQMKTPYGLVSLEEYVRKIYFPYIPVTGNVTLLNGSVIPFSHYILEVLLSVGQEKFDGDIDEIIKNTVLDESIQEKKNNVKR